MSFHDTFGDRMKAYEAVETDRRLDARTGPVYARLDGRGFSKFTRGMARPFDPRMTAAMQRTCADLVAHTKAVIGFTQSDEISLAWELTDENPLAQMLFDGKIQKLVSVLSGYATASFIRALLETPDPEFQGYVQKLPHFDTRIFSLPSREEGANAFLWRVKDAERNAVQMVAQANYSHRELQGVSTKAALEMMERDGIDFHGLPDAFKHGSFYRRERGLQPLTEAARLAIPEAFRPEPGATMARGGVKRLDDIQSFGDVVNRVGVIFDGEAPIRG
jgi:tRNA(His) 5'-end guanylyltransferase